MGEIPTIKIDMNKKCTKCGKPGAMQNGLCLRCATKEIAKRGWRTMETVKTIFLLSDVHPKVKIDGEGIAHHTLSVRLDRRDYKAADAHALMDMLGERVIVTIALEQGKIAGT